MRNIASGDMMGMNRESIVLTGSRQLKDMPYFEDVVEAVFKEAQALMLKKQRDYGPNAITDETGVAYRANDKMSRLTNLLGSDKETLEALVALKEKFDGSEITKETFVVNVMEILGNQPNNESITDTWLDLLNYAAIGYIVHSGAWGKEMRHEDPSEYDEGNTF